MLKIRKTVFLVFIMFIVLVLSGCAEEAQKNEVNLTAEPEEGGEVIGEGTFEVKKKATVIARPAEGYVFEKWTENGEEISTDETYEINVENGKELVAHFAEYESVIKDRNLNKAIQEKLNIEGPIQKEDLKKLTFLSAEGNDVKDLSGLEYAENLEYLSLAKNEIEDVDPLENLPNLKELNLASNNIDISAFDTENGFKNIRSLCLDHNQLNQTNSFSNLNNLEVLYVRDAGITDITDLKNLDHLKALNLSHNKIEDLSPLEEMQNLKYLYLRNNELSGRNIYSLGKLEQLKVLDLTSNKIQNIAYLGSLQNLKTLVLDKNKISAIDSLANLQKLTALGLWDNKIRELPPMKELTNLEILDISNNRIEDTKTIVNLGEDLPNLKHLSLMGNPVTELEKFEETLKELKDKGIDESPPALLQYQGQVFGREFREMIIELYNEYDIDMLR